MFFSALLLFVKFTVFWKFAVTAQAMKTTKMTKKIMRTAKILIISQRFDDTDWKYLRISEWADSIFTVASSTLESILQTQNQSYASVNSNSTYPLMHMCQALLHLEVHTLAVVHTLYAQKVCRHISGMGIASVLGRTKVGSTRHTERFLQQSRLSWPLSLSGLCLPIASCT